MKLLVIDNYDSFTFNLVQLIEQAGVSEYVVVKNDNLKQFNPEGIDKCIISPGPGIASEAGDLLWFIDEYHKHLPILGICLGNEAIAEYFGANLYQLPHPLHGVKNIARIEEYDRIFNGLPDKFSIGHYHSWNVEESSIPPSLEIIVRDENGLNMGVRHKELPIYGLQFHPESIMTDFGLTIVKNWLEA